MTSKLWIIGCSIAHGVGVNTNEKWSTIVADKFNFPVVNLTAPGSSVEWAADQILRADLASNDIVCWGLTTPNRSLWYDDTGNPHHLLNVYYQNNPNFKNLVNPHHLVQLNLAYKAINYVKQVQNFLNKVGCRYAIGYTLPGLIEHEDILLSNLADTKNFVVMYKKSFNREKTDVLKFLSRTVPPTQMFVDIGNDGFHPGPQQHQLYADQFLEVLVK